MTIETKLKELILSRYKSVREFTQIMNMPYSTMASVLHRGVDNSSITNVVKICKELGISVDELANGRITPIGYTTSNQHSTEVNDILNDAKSKLSNYDGLTISGQPASESDISSIINAMDVGVEIAKRKKR